MTNKKELLVDSSHPESPCHVRLPALTIALAIS